MAKRKGVMIGGFVPPALKRDLAASAGLAGRTLTEELVARLSVSLYGAEGVPGPGAAPPSALFSFVAYEPAADISLPELAALTPHFASRLRSYAGGGDWPRGRVVLALTAAELAALGGAARHLRPLAGGGVKV